MDIVIQGIYSTKTILDSAEKATAENGDAYIVGKKMPYDLYVFDSGVFRKEGKVGIAGETPELKDLFSVTFKDGDNSYRLRRSTGRGLRQDTFELYGVK